MSNKIKINVNSLEAKNLLTNPSIVTLDTKDKLILSNISINLDATITNDIQQALYSNVTVLGIMAEEEDCTNGHKWSPVDEGYHECLRPDCGIREECKDFRYEPHEGGGTHTKICIDCGYVYKDDEACTFEYTNNGDGTHTGKCNLCGYTFTENHNKYSYSRREPTCTSDGYTAGGYCRNCSYSWGGSTIPALGHNTTTSTVSPTCTTAGSTTTTCTRCNQVISSSTTPAYGHEPRETRNATHHWKVCARCTEQLTTPVRHYDNNGDGSCDACSYRMS